MVTADTVDQDVYAMQERKAKMNSAIMDNEHQWKKDEKKIKDVIIETAMSRYQKQSQDPTFTKYKPFIVVKINR